MLPRATDDFHMPHTRKAFPHSSLKLFTLILALTFSIEAAIMLLSPYVLPELRSTVFAGIGDAALLTVIMAPAIWLLVVKPIQSLAQSREELLHALMIAQEQERLRIARDLHDEIGQQLTAVQVGLRTIEAAGDLESAKRKAVDLRVLGATAHEEIRRLSTGLGPGVLEDLGLIVALERLCEDFQQRSNVHVRFDCEVESTGNLSQLIEIALYRILQESLTNIARHAQASIVRVTLRRDHDKLKLAISDDGQGLQSSVSDNTTHEQGGLGLSFIRERVQMLDGTCIIGGSELGGTLIKIVVPIRR